EPPGAADGRYHLVARLHRLSPRRVGRGRNRRWFAKRLDAAARFEFQRRLRQSLSRQQERKTTEVLLGLAGDAELQQKRLLPHHSCDHAALWLARGFEDAPRRRTA